MLSKYCYAIVFSFIFAGSNEVEVNHYIFHAGGEGSTLVKQEQITFPKDNFANGTMSCVYKGMYTDKSGTEYPVAVK